MLSGFKLIFSFVCLKESHNVQFTDIYFCTFSPFSISSHHLLSKSSPSPHTMISAFSQSKFLAYFITYNFFIIFDLSLLLTFHPIHFSPSHLKT